MRNIKVKILSSLVAVVTVFCGFSMTACNDGNSGDNSGGNGNEVVTPEKPLALTTSVETNEAGENTYTINAIVSPATLVPRWAITWENSDSEWAADKNTADYLKLELSNGDKTATLSTKQPFGETAILTATISSPTGDVSVSKRVDYELKCDYELSSDGLYYSVVGLKSDSCISSLGVPSMYNGLPVKAIGAEAFRDSALEYIVLPDSVTSIGRWAFYNCESLKKIVFSENVSYIGVSAFSGCSSLESFTFPKSFSKLTGETKILINCYSLKTLYWNCSNFYTVFGIGDYLHFSNTSSPAPSYTLIFGDEVTSLPSNACRGLSCSKVVIPASVTSIGHNAFAGCFSLTNVTFLGDKSKIEIAETAFSGCPYQP